MKVTGYKDSHGRMHWCVHTPRGLAPFANSKETAIYVAGSHTHYAMSFGCIKEQDLPAKYRKVASFNVEQRNAK